MALFREGNLPASLKHIACSDMSTRPLFFREGNLPASLKLGQPRRSGQRCQHFPGGKPSGLIEAQSIRRSSRTISAAIFREGNLPASLKLDHPLGYDDPRIEFSGRETGSISVHAGIDPGSMAMTRCLRD